MIAACTASQEAAVRTRIAGPPGDSAWYKDSSVILGTNRSEARSQLRIFVFLHVLSMFSAVALSGGSEIFLMQIARTRNPPAIRTAFEVHNQIVRFIPWAFIIGLAFGLIAIFVHQFNPFAPWLLLAYPLFVAGILTGALGIGPWADRVREAAAVSGDETSAELEAAIANPRGRYAQIAFWLVVAAIVFVMVMKPLS